MFLSHLSLTHFRNYSRLELDFLAPLTLIQGRNAQGKSNLLEAVYFLATSKSVHARIEQEVVDWQAVEEPIPYCQIVGHVQSQGQDFELEVLFVPRPDGAHFQKQVRINGVNKRSLDLLGILPAVLFLPEDVVLVSGSPGERRRYLDIALCQLDRQYCQHLSTFQKVLSQRNSLLKMLRETGARPESDSTDAQLDFWDAKLVYHGTAIMARRHSFLRRLDTLARERHQDLTAQQEQLYLHYLPSFNPGHLTEQEFQSLADEALLPQPVPTLNGTLSRDMIAEQYLATLRSRRRREILAGNTLYGPHRDEMRFFANGRDLRTYGSRGQQRTAALALKLAEVLAMREETGEMPLLLLDDVMSELDAQRRSTLLTALNGVSQSIITTTDWQVFSQEFKQQAQLLCVDAGTVQPVEEVAG